MALCCKCKSREERHEARFLPKLVGFCKQCVNNARRDLRKGGIMLTNETPGALELMRERLEGLIGRQNGNGAHSAPVRPAPARAGRRAPQADPEHLDMVLLKQQLGSLEDALDLLAGITSAMRRTVGRLSPKATEARTS